MRLFFGLSLPRDVRAITQDCAGAAERMIPGRYAIGENHHITLAFLGEVAPERVEAARAILQRCVQEFPAPRLTLEGFSYFGRRENAILILKVKSEPALDGLHSCLVSELKAAGLPADEGPFSPHITLARHAKIGERMPDCPAISFEAAKAHVFLSARDEENILRYTPLHTVFFLK